MKNFYLLYFICTILLCCKSKTESKSSSPQSLSSPSQESASAENYDTEEETGYEDGTYCATIDYYNSSTGKSSTYTLEVEIQNGELVQINWPNGGWLDSSHFDPPEVGADGSCSFSTYDGKDYDIQIEDKGGCGYSNSSPDDEEEMDTEENTEEEELEVSVTQKKYQWYSYLKIYPLTEV